ncbi:hypothetical protein LNN92_14735 [Klebsiella variicola subsp. variicola]|nr:hypothetical protein [Klebsiella variicola subsp. variicola]
MLDLPQQENSNRENPMKSFKIEYVDGVLTVLETDGQSRMNEAVHGIHFEHVQGGRPLLKLTIAHDIAPAPVSSPVLDQEPLEGGVGAGTTDNGSRWSPFTSSSWR